MATTNGFTPCELNDWEWQKFQREFDIINWDQDLEGVQRIGVALVGFGRMGLVHMRNLLREPRAKLLYCIDANQALLDACSRSVFFKELGIKALHSDQLELALADPNVQAVVCAAPTAFHHSIVKKSLEAGKNVMCEKPLSINSSDIMPLYEMAKSKKLFLVTAFNRHYDEDFRKMRQQVISNDIGSIQMIRTTSRDGQRPPMTYIKVSGGCFHDTCIHDFDQIIWIKRQLPVSVQVSGRTWKQYFESEPELLEQLNPVDRKLVPEITDYFLVVIKLQFPDGSIGLLDTSRYSSYGYDQRCEIFGSRGMLKCDGKETSNVFQSNENGRSNVGINFAFASRYSAAYQHELEDFLTMANISVRGKYDDKELVRRQVREFPRGTLTAAAAKVADTCSEAVKTGSVTKIDWPEEFRRQFEEEILL